jgi:hypothetical protein
MLLLPVGPSAGSPKSGGPTKVVCLNDKTFNHEYKFRPKHCIFHKRHAPNAEAFFVRTKHDHWSVWNRQRARGKGKAKRRSYAPVQSRDTARAMRRRSASLPMPNAVSDTVSG